ncbi:MAG: BamA/TamA family outer membrane protein [Bacteroidaceae bacterium]|nr:BamA/TamA family outer membrane protein [Bacteroidaceae bacterium]
MITKHLAKLAKPAITPLTPKPKGLITPLIIILTACSTTRNLPEEETLYTGIKRIEYVNDSALRHTEAALDEVEAALAYPPNNAIFGSSSYRFPLPFGLWVYNAFVNHQRGVGKWVFNNFAAEPVYMSAVNPEVRSKVATNLLRDYGFFRGRVASEVIPQKNPRKEKVAYRVNAGHLFTLDSIQYRRFPYVADTLIRFTAKEKLLHAGDPFSVVQLESERNRLSTLFRNNGYYYYRGDYITFRADTIQRPGHVWLQVQPREGLPSVVNRQWYIGKTVVNLHNNNRRQLEDTLQIRHLTVNYTGKKPPLRPGVLFHNFRFRHGDLYSQEKQRLSQENMARMGVFSSVDMQFVPRDTTATCDTLDVVVSATFDKPLDVELEVNATSKSNDQIGPGLSFGVAKKNVFRGGETFSVKLDASYEWQTGGTATGKSAEINSWELGLSTALTYPRLMFPGLNTRRFRFPAQTEFKLYANQLNRAGFFRLLSFGGNAVYSFQPTRTSKHTFTPFRLTFNMLQSHTAKFDSIMEQNRALAISFRDQFIPAMSYTYTFDDASITSRRHHTWWSTTVTSAGNVTSALYALCGSPFSKRDKSLLGNPFAQFFKATTELRNLFKVRGRTHVATRLMAGVIIPYGNSQYAPYSEQFYIGGANSIRAFTARTIGPGSFHPEESTYSYLDETGDVKLEANVELRFPIVGNLYGATFLDAGNVWLLHPQADRPGGTLTLNDLWNDIALGTGLGLRYDLEFLVLRLDLGIAIHVPYDTGKSGYYNIPRFKDGLGLHLAVGYPF